MNNTVIGLDCGASHSTIKIWSDGKSVLERHDLPGANLDLINAKETADRLMLEFEDLKSFPGAGWVVGMAGLDSAVEVFEAEKWLRSLMEKTVDYSSLNVIPDIDLVLWSGSVEGVGIGLISGTGSNCVGRNKSGVVKKVGGMSHVLSDEGGGFSLGWRCLHLVAKMLDGRTTKTDLVDEIFVAYGVNNIIELKNLLVISPQQKVDVAKAAPLLLQASYRGEDDAGKIVAEESLELIKMIATVDEFFKDENLPLFIAGSLFKNNSYRDLLLTGMSRYFSQKKVLSVNPIDGAFNYSKIYAK